MLENEKDFPKGEKRPTPQDKDREAQQRRVAKGAGYTALNDKK